jgi:ABC-type phosphate/phosphonate transport system permease subunit
MLQNELAMLQRVVAMPRKASEDRRAWSLITWVVVVLFLVLVSAELAKLEKFAELGELTELAKQLGLKLPLQRTMIGLVFLYQTY